MIAVRVIVHGRVQGVWFRAWTIEEAEKRGLDGWVRNRSDGTVEAVFAGDEMLIEDIVESCREGPLHARVTEVERFTCDGAVEPGFHQRPTE